MIATLITHPACHLHLMPEGHPECPERLDAINNQLLASGIDSLIYHRESPAATDEQLLRVHTHDYLQRLAQAQPDEGILRFADDIYLSPGTLTAARHAAGAGILGVDMVMRGETDAVFCNVRPAGHHAESAKAMGFCIFNNVAIAAAHALAAHHLERIAIVDFDVHHGNGTQEIFRHEPRVLFCSSFQHPFYPLTPIDNVPDHIINIPLPATCRSEGFRAALTEHCLPALTRFQPQLLLISAGFDGHLDDDMSSIRLVEQDYVWITQQLRQLVDNSKNNPDVTQQCRGMVSLLEGGYDLPALGRCAMMHIKAMAKLS
ncbi:histone deacetylase family protein [Cellvibrio sp. PSBB006]|uniref:histone deacetylase family protein n=1 Tax=Cellvibrio sp. PSBB006 TaxID=1987723 RepID=UPI000B3B5950|nr:histone deacetylase family protein [Cellvibrio sp. PSBB006]ARU25973.1 deacetylase [Cellvibrio sp. PSBB006]